MNKSGVLMKVTGEIPVDVKDEVHMSADQELQMEPKYSNILELTHKLWIDVVKI